MIIDRKRKEGFEVWKLKGDPQLYLMMLNNSRCRPHLKGCHGGWWHIPLEHGGELAMTAPQPYKCRLMSFRTLPDNVKEQVRVAVAYIEAHGTPMENDESVYKEHFDV